MSEESFSGLAANEAKRVLQWLLGCTYAKKTFKTRIQEMFHFSDAPHVIVVEKFEGRSWWSTTGVIIGVLICVLTVYYIAESIIRSVKRFLKNALQEQPGTITTPTALSPSGSHEQMFISGREREMSTNSGSIPRSSSKIKVAKVQMNEPVNCVFVRPTSPSSSSLSVPSISTQAAKPGRSPANKVNKSLDPLASPLECSSPVGSPPREKEVHSFSLIPESNEVGKKKKKKSSEIEGKMDERCDGGADLMTSTVDCGGKQGFDSDGFLKWLQKQALEIDSENGSLSSASTSDQFLEQIEKFVESGENSIMEEAQSDSSGENISEMSPVSMSIQSPDPKQESINLRTIASDDGDWSRAHFSPISEDDISSEIEQIAKENTNITDDIDVIIDDNYLFADTENESFGKVLLKEGQSKVLFRWTDDEKDTVDTVTITGSFFGWKMNLPMRKCSTDRLIFQT